MEKAYLLVELKGNLQSLPCKSLITGNKSLIFATSEIGWKNLISPDSEASPVVGISKYNMLLSFYYHRTSSSLIFWSFYAWVFNDLSLLIIETLSAGKLLSKLATEQTTALYCKDLNPGSLISYSY